MTLSIEDVKILLGLDGDDHDELIGMIIPIQTSYVQQLLGKNIEEFTETEMDIFTLLLIASIGCYLIKVIPDFGTKRFNYRVGNVSETFMRRYYRDYEDWCDFYNNLIDDLENLLELNTSSVIKRSGVTDEYTRPY